MAYIAKSVCKFAGHNFLKGEVIPEELVLKSKVPQLVKTKVIEVVEGNLPAKVLKQPETIEADEPVSDTDNPEEQPAKRGRKKKSE